MKIYSLMYLWAKLLKKLRGSSIYNCKKDQTSKIEAGSTVINSEFGRYSYCGYNCKVLNTSIGNFCSVADNVKIGLSNHPLNWISSSCAFYYGKDSISKKLASLEYLPMNNRNTICSDVWIGEDAIILSGVNIGIGAVVGAGAVVTKDVPDFAIVVGVPAKVVGYRFDSELRTKILESKWWTLSDSEIRDISMYANQPEAFVSQVVNVNILKGR